MGDLFFEKLTDACHHLLMSHDSLLGYLKEKRGLQKSTIKTYKLGAFPRDLRKFDTWMCPKELRERGIIWDAGKSPFQMYPIVVPINDVQGKPVAIGCRTLLSDEKREQIGIPKYRNSVYTKTSFLFGLDRAVEYIREKDKVFVVEGYFDQITPYQHGIRNVVATCGTIFSHRQMSILSRYTGNIVLLFDNDKPGHLSARRVKKKLEEVEHEGVELTYEFVPDGYKDLDEYLRKGGDASLFGKERIDFDEVEIETLW